MFSSSSIYGSTRQVYKLGEKGSGSRQIGDIQDFYKLRDKCFADGRLFEDPTFDTIGSNICHNRTLAKPIKWKRPNELVNNPHFYVEGVSRFDVVQGELGNCWFLAAVSNLTLYPGLFHKVVPEDQGFSTTEKYSGIFHFFFWQYGKWIDVVVDDRLPTDGEKLVFLHSEDQNEFWSALLEKAYAKLHGSYEALKGGKVGEALVDFTGGLTENYQLGNGNAPPSNLFTIMQKAHERFSLMGCYITYLNKTDSDCQNLPSGLVAGHAYSITDIKLMHINTLRMTGKVELLRIRNPWGSAVEWNGAWSDKSIEWQLLSENEKKSLGLVVAADGEFWMSYSDFLTNFNGLEICNLEPASLEEAHSSRKCWECKSFEGSWMKGSTAGGCREFIDTFACNPQYRIVLEDPDENDDDDKCTLIVALMQKHRRAEKKMGVRLHLIGFAIYRLDNPDSSPRPLPRNFFEHNCNAAQINTFINMREVSQRFKLTPGTYCIIPSTFESNQEGDFLLRVYSETKTDMNENEKPISITNAEDSVIKEAMQYESSDVIKETYRRIAGEDLEIDAYELKDVLDHVLKKEFDFDGFGINLCRGMVAMMDSDFSGKLGFDEFKELWFNIVTWKRVFKQFDKNNSSTLTSFELRDALASAGYHLNWHVLNVLTFRYANKNNEVSFEDFITCAVKLKAMSMAFKKRDKNGRNEALFTLDEWITLTMYA